MKTTIAIVTKLSAAMVAALLLTTLLTGAPPQESPNPTFRGNKAGPQNQVEQSARADGKDDAKVIDRDSVAYGRTYGEWLAAWDQYYYSFPVTASPMFDTADCSAGQSGPVWFLPSTFTEPSPLVRECTVPYGEALFVPIVNWEDSTLEESVVENPCNPDYQQINALRSFIDSAVQGFTGQYFWIDGKPIPNVRERFRIQSTVFGFTLPDNNLLTAVYGTTFEAGTYFPAVDDGWAVMLAPLPVGDHVLRYGWARFDVTCHLHVTRPGNQPTAPATPPRLKWERR